MTTTHTDIHCKGELNEVSLRATPARIAVLRLLETTKTPVDVAMIKDHLDNKHILTDPATVFRIMNMFTEKGIVKQISFNEGKFRYELSNKPDHHHLICTSCGEIEDFSDCNIPALEHDITKKKGFTVKAHSLEFYGICASCQKKQN
ncbi:MAG: Fur family transcriptional regulator [Candidatus Levyibacteriota bacterium]